MPTHSQPRLCDRCSAPLDDPSLDEMFEAEQEYRDNFPSTWDKEITGVKSRSIVCANCYDEITKEQC